MVEARPNTLDREASSEVTVRVRAANSAEPLYFSTAVVRVVLLDINDNAPRFEFSSVEVSVLENATLGSVVTNLQAADQDALSTNVRIGFK